MNTMKKRLTSIIILALITVFSLNVNYSFAYDEGDENEKRTYSEEELKEVEDNVQKRLNEIYNLKGIIPYSTKRRVVIDPGHGGNDSGAVSRDKSVYEKNLNIDIANATARYLRNNGIEVIMTRETDKRVELKERSTLSNAVDPSLFVSIHNDTAEGNGNGAHVIYSLKDKNGGASKTLASNILNSIDSNTIQNKASKGIWTRQGSDGLDYYHVIREVKAPSVIVECSYMNPTDIQAVDTLSKRVAMGEAIGKGIMQTLKSMYPDYEGHWAEEYITDAMNRGWIIKSNEFRPDDSITRAEFIKIVNNVFGIRGFASENFDDVQPNDWFYDHVRAGINAGYINTLNTKFRPHDPITREEACKIVGSIANIVGDGKVHYKDAGQIQEWAIYYVDGLTERGILTSLNTEFRPQDNITRAEALKVIVMSSK